MCAVAFDSVAVNTLPFLVTPMRSEGMVEDLKESVAERGGCF